MQNPKSSEAAAPRLKRGSSRRTRIALSAGAGAVVLVVLLVVGLSATAADPRESTTRTAVASCVEASGTDRSIGLRFARCRERVVAWLDARDGDLRGLKLARWASGTSPSKGSPVTDSIPRTGRRGVNPTAVAAGFTARFGSRPSSGAVACRGRSNVTISGKTFRGIGNDTPAITIRNCTNVRIVQNDFIDDTEPILVIDSTNVTIEYNRYRNITGPHERNGSHRGNFTQWVKSFGGSISHNVGIGGDTEDIVSIYKSGGRSGADPLVIADNWFQGTNWTSQSGSGMLLGDRGGDHVVARDNVLVNPGQTGIGIAGGTDIRVLNNTVLGQRRTASNVGIYVWGQKAACSGIRVQGNTVDFARSSGRANGAWDHGNCGPVAGWRDNDWTADLRLNLLEVAL